MFWIDATQKAGKSKCTECGGVIEEYEKDYFSYCPYCGAHAKDMEIEYFIGVLDGLSKLCVEKFERKSTIPEEMVNALYHLKWAVDGAIGHEEKHTTD